jgi:hypothetical protein
VANKARLLVLLEFLQKYLFPLSKGEGAGGEAKKALLKEVYSL